VHSRGTNRRDFLTTVAKAGAALAISPAALLASGSDDVASRRRPNIIYLFSDQHRYQSMSFTEMPELKTPNLARMARQGTSFEYAISNNPVCVPYRSSLLSGLWPHRTGAVENTGGLSAWDRTLGDVFKAAGYVTGYTGKWHAGMFPAHAGFDWHMNWRDTGNHWNSSWTDLSNGGRRQDCKTYNATKMTDQAVEFIESCAGGEAPFFLMVSWNPPHYIFIDAPADKKALYPSADKLPWRRNAMERTKAKRWPDYQGYHAHVTAIDQEAGRILAKLAQLGIDDSTIVLYSSDHGSMMNSHGKGDKRHPEDESCRVPFLVTGPGVPAGEIRRELFGAIDIFPTLCGLAGIDIPSFCDGMDFSPNILGKPGGPDPESQLLMNVANLSLRRYYETVSREVIRAHHTPLFRGVRGKRYTYTVDSRGEWRLWDNEKDPYQMTNLVKDPAHAQVRARMREQLDAWLSKAEDPFLHEDYLKMPLSERICQQALDGRRQLPLHNIVMRLKLSPQQYPELHEIRSRFYDDTTGHPHIKGGAKAWKDAAKGVEDATKGVLTPAQLDRFYELLAKQKAVTG